MKKLFSREVKIGVVVVVAIGMLYFGLNYLKGVNIFKPDTYFYAQYERVDGIVKTTPVLVNGFQVGHVSDIIFDYTKEAPIVLEITVDKKLVIPVGTVAEVYDSGLMGDKAIQLKLGKNSEVHTTGDTLLSGTQNGLIAGIVDKILPPILELVPSIDSTIIALKNVVESPEVKSLIQNADATMANLKRSTGKLDGVIDTVQYICNDLSTVTKSLDKVDWDSTMVSIESTIAKANNIAVNTSPFVLFFASLTLRSPLLILLILFILLYHV